MLRKELAMHVDYSTLADHNVTKLRREDGELMDILGVRVLWKAKAKEMGFAFSVYEMELAPGQGVPLHAFPYAKYVYVLEGTLSVLRMGSDDQQEQVQCQAGESAQVPRNAPHGYLNSSDRPVRFLATSTFDHEAILTTVGVHVKPTDEITQLSAEDAQRFEKVSAEYQGYFVVLPDSGRVLQS
jgi:quercetin dioxygenase-like cupin family protein